VTKLLLTAATAAVFLCSSLATLNYAKAEDWPDQHARSQAYEAPIGEKGVRWGAQCWVDTSGGGYWGYWKPCEPTARTAKR
jgi:hypothetical protein